MYDIKPLEEKWKQYNRKKRKPYYITIFIFILFGLLYFTVSSFRSISVPFKQVTHINIADTKKKIMKSLILLNDSVKTLETEEKIKKIEDLAPVKEITEIPLLNETTIQQSSKPIKKMKKEKRHKKIHLKIIETSHVSAYKDVENRFYQSHELEDSLFLARAYFHRGNYKKAVYWALQTNRINQNIEESWLIFVRSKVKLGHKNEAIGILESYIKKSHSEVARKLLKKLKK